MSYELAGALAVFAFVSSITPGPNNLMLMASGANYGFRRTIPHMLGVGLGFVFMVLVLGSGAGRLVAETPELLMMLKAVSVVYMLWLAWKIANAAPPEAAAAPGRPLTFLQAAGFQWVNPKAWAMALSAVTVYAPGQDFLSILAVGLIFGAINLPSVSSWTLAGQQMRRLIGSRRRLRIFNLMMAALLLASLYPVLMP
ncbi:MAG: hypothetical protein TEF_12330 [Rhizobiales bacterium NRL2]|jgi:threonine/homoserine/homoserine lactone efflux protein|nr:MAG: hypothetical protein TEF_12330 [Rhizobiales bacterium NRL2]